jgi:hypothetical protein
MRRSEDEAPPRCDCLYLGPLPVSDGYPDPGRQARWNCCRNPRSKTIKARSFCEPLSRVPLILPSPRARGPNHGDAPGKAGPICAILKSWCIIPTPQAIKWPSISKLLSHCAEKGRPLGKRSWRACVMSFYGRSLKLVRLSYAFGFVESFALKLQNLRVLSWQVRLLDFVYLPP